MKLIDTPLEGVYIIENFYSSDERGSFTKTFHSEDFADSKLCTDFKESYFSVSNKNVIRGMHFQLPPYDHDKLVYVANGAVIDVVFDMRKNSMTFGESISLELSDSNHRSIYIPKGLAHGFRSIRDNTIMVYNVSTEYNSEADFGVRFDSIGYDWSITEPIISKRDSLLQTFAEFSKRNPF